MTKKKTFAPALIHPDETDHLASAQAPRLFDTAPEPMFDNLTALASKVFGTPIVLISLQDRQRRFLKSVFDESPLEVSRRRSLSAHAYWSDAVLIVPDARRDERFRNNPLVAAEPGIRFYAGTPLVAKSGQILGTFCVLDLQPRSDFGSEQYIQLQRFATLTSNLVEQRLLERDLRDANERFVRATKASTDGIFDLDYISGELHCSARWNTILGLPDSDTSGKLQDWIDRIHPLDYDRVADRWQGLLRSRELSSELEFRCRHADGSWIWICTRVCCQRAGNGALLRITGSSTDITAAKLVDPLTGLHNRTSLLEHMQWRIDRQEDCRRGYGLLFVDLDAFKRINDSLGHRRGDALLVEVARRLEQTVQCSSGSIVSRLGGDEFVVFVDDVEAADDVLTYAALLEHLLSNAVDCDGQQVFISASIGVVFGNADYTRAEQVLEDADVAMYRAKMKGKAQNAMFSEGMREEARARMQLESELRKALENDELEVWYQPKVLLSTGYVKGFEALVRWRHPTRGLIPPMQFIPIAEEIGLISEIGRWVTRRAITELADWRAKGLVSESATMAVNVSPRQFKDPDLLRYIQSQFLPFDLPPACFIVEVTESVLVEDSAASLALLESIVAAGIGLDLDDFGTGYSSLSYLHRFPFCSVKIDRSFINRMTTDPESVALVASIVSLANSLKMGVVAEGVENESQAKHLRDMGCNFAQGYLFAPPRPAEEVTRYLRERTNPQGAMGLAGVTASPKAVSSRARSVASPLRSPRKPEMFPRPMGSPGESGRPAPKAPPTAPEPAFWTKAPQLPDTYPKTILPA